MRIALAQYALGPDMECNLTKAVKFMSDAGRAATDLLLFPELCVSPFFPRLLGQDASRFAVSLDDDCVRAFQAGCLEHELIACPNVYLREGDYLFDASLMIGSDGNLQGISKMVHIAQAPGFYEQDYYTPSDTGFRVYETVLGTVGIVVCFDRHYPESIRTCVLRGASLILIPTANTMDEPRDLFDCELRAAALQNGVFIAMCNRVGAEGDAVFCGESMVVDPYGNIVARATCSESMIVVDIDLSQVTTARSIRPYLALRRPEMYA